MDKEPTFQERIESHLNPEGLKRAASVLAVELTFYPDLNSFVSAAKVIAAYLLGASEAEQPGAKR